MGLWQVVGGGLCSFSSACGHLTDLPFFMVMPPCKVKEVLALNAHGLSDKAGRGGMQKCIQSNGYTSSLAVEEHYVYFLTLPPLGGAQRYSPQAC